jgi:simple sugar transport system permease protein
MRAVAARAFGGGTLGLAIRTAIALAGAALVGGLAVRLAGQPPIETLRAIIDAAVGDSYALQSTLLTAVPITAAALGVAIAYRAGLFNLGGDGQIYMGALGAVLVALAGEGLPQAVLLPAVLLAGAAGGLVWGAVAGALRARLGLSELISTIMLNFIAFWIVSYLVRGPIEDPLGGGYPYTREIPAAAQLGSVVGTVPVGWVIVAGMALVLWLAMERTRAGRHVKDIGEAEPAARFAGIRVELYMFGLLALAGALAGLGGAAELSGNQLRLSDFFSPNWGFDAVAVALIGRGSPIGTLAAGFFFAALRSGVEGAQGTANVPVSVAQVVQGVAVLFLIIANADVVVRALRRIRLRRSAAEAA